MAERSHNFDSSGTPDANSTSTPATFLSHAISHGAGDTWLVFANWAWQDSDNNDHILADLYDGSAILVGAELCRESTGAWISSYGLAWPINFGMAGSTTVSLRHYTDGGTVTSTISGGSLCSMLLGSDDKADSATPGATTTSATFSSTSMPSITLDADGTYQIIALVAFGTDAPNTDAAFRLNVATVGQHEYHSQNPREAAASFGTPLIILDRVERSGSDVTVTLEYASPDGSTTVTVVAAALIAIRTEDFTEAFWAEERSGVTHTGDSNFSSVLSDSFSLGESGDYLVAASCLTSLTAVSASSGDRHSTDFQIGGAGFGSEAVGISREADSNAELDPHCWMTVEAPGAGSRGYELRQATADASFTVVTQNGAFFVLALEEVGGGGGPTTGKNLGLLGVGA